MKHPLVSVILVNWNGKKYLDACLESLRVVKYSPYEIIVVDNASTDGSAAWVKATYAHVRLVENKENKGFAGGHDAGLAVAKGKYILILNVDTIVEPSFLTPLINRLERDPGIAVVQPKVVLGTNPRLIDSVGSFFLPNGLLYHYGREKEEKLPEYNVPMDIFSAKGVCMALRREVIDRVGLFDPDFFAYFEETDFCMRVWLAGWHVVYEPTSRIMHAGGAASSRQPSSFIVYHSSKNVICTHLKNLSVVYALRAVFSVLLLYGVWIIISLMTGKLSTAYAVLRAVWWNVLNFGQTLHKRKEVQRVMRTRPDEAFLPAVTRLVKPSYYFEQFFGDLGRYRDIPI